MGAGVQPAWKVGTESSCHATDRAEVVRTEASGRRGVTAGKAGSAGLGTAGAAAHKGMGRAAGATAAVRAKARALILGPGTVAWDKRIAQPPRESSGTLSLAPSALVPGGPSSASPINLIRLSCPGGGSASPKSGSWNPAQRQSVRMGSRDKAPPGSRRGARASPGERPSRGRLRWPPRPVPQSGHDPIAVPVPFDPETRHRSLVGGRGPRRGGRRSSPVCVPRKRCPGAGWSRKPRCLVPLGSSNQPC